MTTSSIKREMLACAGILIAGAVLTVALFVFAAAFLIHNDQPAAARAAAKPACAAEVDVVTVWKDDPTPCDLTTQRLDVAGLTFANDHPIQICEDMGGDWIGDGVDICQDVDY